MSAQRIYQDLVCVHGFVGSYQAVKRFVRQLRQTQPVGDLIEELGRIGINASTMFPEIESAAKYISRKFGA